MHTKRRLGGVCHQFGLTLVAWDGMGWACHSRYRCGPQCKGPRQMSSDLRALGSDCTTLDMAALRCAALHRVMEAFLLQSLA